MTKGVLNESISVTISPDKMNAFLTLIVDPGTKVQAEEVFARLIKEGIIFGIDIAKINSLCQGEQKVFREMIAQGTRSIAGEDAVINYRYQKPEFKPRLTPDGKVDYYELGNIVEVKKGDILGERQALTPGEPGHNVRGEILQPVTGKNKAFQIGKGVKVEGDTARAEYDGSLDWQGTKLSVSRLFVVKGDVDFSVGNISFPGKVRITGSVRSGFRVEAEEDIEIRGGIEDAEVSSKKGSVFIYEGIIGRGKATVNAYRNVEARFIQEASVEAGKNIIANEYIIRSNIKAGDAVLIQGSKGRLLGNNNIVARTQIKVNSIQSTNGLNLTVQGINRTQTYLRLKEIDQEMKKSELDLRDMSLRLRMIGEKKDIDSMKQLRDVLPAYISLTAEMDQIKEEKSYLTNLLRTTKGEGMIEIRSEVDYGTSLEIKGERWELKKPLKNVTMYFDHEEKRIIILKN